MSSLSLNAELRTERGKNENYRLREAGFIPAVVYSHGESQVVKVNAREFNRLFHGHISESVIIDLNVKDSDALQVYVKDYQTHPIHDTIEHVDFFKITAGEKIKTIIPVEYVGTASGVRKGGVFEILDRELEVEVLPKDLPEKIEIDIAKLEINEGIHIKDIERPESLSFMADDEHVVAHVLAARGAQAEEEESTEGEEETPAE